MSSRNYGRAISRRPRKLKADGTPRKKPTDWEGNAKLAAIDAVGGFTTSARAKCDEAEQALTAYITRQVQSVVAADR